MTDKAIREACEQRHAGKSFENLCTLYVALTRAKYEVCVLMPDLTKNQKHDYHSDVSDRKRGVQVRRLFCDSQKSYCNKDLLFDTFLQDKNLFPLERPLPLQNVSEVPFLIRTIGNPAWTETLKTEPPPVPPSLFEIPPPENPLPPRTVRIVPNQAGRNAGEFRFPSRSGAQDSGTGFGLEVHAFFETVENLASFVPPENLPLPVKRHYDACMKNPEVLKLLSGTDELWRERRFDVILHQDGVRKFVSGCFDRVQIRRDAGGKPVQAEIVDFKSNDVTEETLADAAEHYRGQMTVYRSALSKLLDLPEDRIGCTLLFTKLGRLCRM